MSETAVEETQPMLARVRVSRTSQIAEDTFLYELKDPKGADLLEFKAGAYLSVRTPGGLVRKYSICNDPIERDRYEIAVKREPGASTSASFVGQTKVGDQLLISKPRNNFVLARRAPGFIFIADGIGITPIMSMIRHLKSSDLRKFKVCYCARTPDSTPFREELSGPDFKDQVTIHYDYGDPARAFDLSPILSLVVPEHLYACGPHAFLVDIRDRTGHWPASNVHFEAFGGPTRAARAHDKPFKVILAKSGEVVEVGAQQTILDALRKRGHRVPSTCESGTCGSCRTRLISGEVEHRDLVLTDAERADNIMVCISRARSGDIVIDR
jgi:phthalate 4,5-dioxygenase reductase subunit